MFQSPQSLTATVYVRFNYKEPETLPSGETPTEMIGGILDQASVLDPVLQEVLVKFADYLKRLDQKEGSVKFADYLKRFDQKNEE